MENLFILVLTLLVGIMGGVFSEYGIRKRSLYSIIFAIFAICLTGGLISYYGGEYLRENFFSEGFGFFAGIMLSSMTAKKKLAQR